MSTLTAPDRLTSAILDVADYLGWQDDGEGGGFDLFNLRKSIPGHPEGSTVSRQTLEKALRVWPTASECASNLVHDERTEARSFLKRRTNFHDL